MTKTQRGGYSIYRIETLYITNPAIAVYKSSEAHCDTLCIMVLIDAPLVARPGNIICAKLGDTPALSRKACFEIVQNMFADEKVKERYGITDDMVFYISIWKQFSNCSHCCKVT